MNHGLLLATPILHPALEGGRGFTTPSENIPLSSSHLEGSLVMTRWEIFEEPTSCFIQKEKRGRKGGRKKKKKERKREKRGERKGIPHLLSNYVCMRKVQPIIAYYHRGIHFPPSPPVRGNATSITNPPPTTPSPTNIFDKRPGYIGCEKLQVLKP